MIGSLGAEGSTALMVIEGATDAAVFRAYVKHVLVPTLRPGEIVVMDNLSSHKSPEIREMIEAAGAELWYLPPYSPDLNPSRRCGRRSRHCSGHTRHAERKNSTRPSAKRYERSSRRTHAAGSRPADTATAILELL